MFIHFTFEDGSNPYFFRGSEKEARAELARWKKNYVIKKEADGFYRLSEKEKGGNDHGFQKWI